jgi:hypothetical protein
MKNPFAEYLRLGRMIEQAKREGRMDELMRPAKEYAELHKTMMQPSAKQANFDGSFSLGWGSSLLCFGMVAYLNPILPKSVWASWWTAWIGYVPLLCAVFAVYGIPKLVKHFITWPRTGYVALPNEVKLRQLILLMIFGGALGFSLVMPFILFFEIQDAIRHTGPQSGLPTIIWQSVKLLLCLALVIFLGRKVITRRRPLPPAAYDNEQIKQAFSQTPEGRKILVGVRLSLTVLFVVLPLLALGLMIGIFHLSRGLIRISEFHWPQLGLMGLFLAANAMMYLMSNALGIKQQWWKWLVLALMIVGPIGVLATVPYPAFPPEMKPVLELFPHQVMLFLGLAWMLSGLISLICFVRQHPLPAPETE